MKRRTFMCSLCAGGALAPLTHASGPRTSEGQRRLLICPGKPAKPVKVALLFLGREGAHWPTPTLNIKAERESYLVELSKHKEELGDFTFLTKDLVSREADVDSLSGVIKKADCVLLVQLTMWISGILNRILSLGKPTFLYAAPYSGHEWTGYGRLLETRQNLIDVALTSDRGELLRLLRPVRALVFLRQAKVLNVIKRDRSRGYEHALKEKLGVSFIQIGRDPVLEAYNSVPEAEAEKEADAWIKGAEKVVEPKRPEIVKSARLALAFEKLLRQYEACCIGVDCYGTMYHRLPAFPCLGFVRLNNMGLSGICESDMSSAVTFLLYWGLVRRPGFISDPTIDTAKNAAILAHCLGTPKMDGPWGEASPYRLRTIMERQEGVVPQVRMRIGQRITQARVVSDSEILFFTGKIIETPDLPRGCRTKITCQVDGNAETLWRNWTHGLHRVTCYGDIVKDLERFCRLTGMKLTKEV